MTARNLAVHWAGHSVAPKENLTGHQSAAPWADKSVARRAQTKAEYWVLSMADRTEASLVEPSAGLRVETKAG